MRLIRDGLLAATVASVLLICAGGERAGADQGVAVDLGRIAIDKKLSKGGTYQLPIMGVTNPGDERTRYQMGVSYFEGQTEERPPLEWFTFSPAEFELEPGRTQPVTTSLRIPSGAEPADYLGLLQASIASDREGARVGAAAGARLSFTVKPSSLLEAWTLRLRDRLDDWMPWTYVVPALAALALAAWWLGRRFRFTVSRKR